MEFTAQQIAALIGGNVVGDATAKVSDVSKIEDGREGTLSFVADAKFVPYLATTAATVAIVTRSLDRSALAEVRPTLIEVDDARAAVAQLLSVVQTMMTPRRRGVEQPAYVAEGVELTEDTYVGAFAYIGRGATVGAGCQIYPQVYIGEGARIGRDVTLYAGVKVYAGCVVGDGCIVHAGAVIGADGFGFVPQDGAYRKMPQVGNVVLEGDNEIGANTTIDRATMGSTVIRRGTKIDNLVQIGHNVEVGANTILCAQVGIAGSTQVGEWCTLAGQVGVAGHIRVGNHVTVGAQSGIPGNTKDGVTLMGYPAIPARDWSRQAVMLKRLEQMQADIAELKKKP